jgi:phosphonatase-like hydrolase
MPIELVVFDMAGTTVNDPGAVSGCLQAALAAAGLVVNRAEVSQVMGMPKREALRRLIERSDRRDSLLGRLGEIHTDFTARMTRFYRTDPAVSEVPGTRQAFAALNAVGIRVALNTGFSRDIAQVLIDRLGWEKEGLVQASVTSDEVPRGRPHPDMIHALMARLGVPDPKRVAKVGDTPVDLEEGANAGCGLVIGVTGGTHTRQQLERFPHTHLVGSVADVPPLVGA